MNEAVAHLNDAFLQLDKAISQFEKEGYFAKAIAARGAQNILQAAITYILQALSISNDNPLPQPSSFGWFFSSKKEAPLSNAAYL